MYGMAVGGDSPQVISILIYLLVAAIPAPRRYVFT